MLTVHVEFLIKHGTYDMYTHHVLNVSICMLRGISTKMHLPLPCTKT